MIDCISIENKWSVLSLCHLMSALFIRAISGQLEPTHMDVGVQRCDHVFA